MSVPFVSVVIPERNEEEKISFCLESLLGSDYPHDRFEVIVVDGMSEDRTVEIVKSFSEQHQNIKLLYNEKRTTPVARNIGIKASVGEYVMFFDAHSVASFDYISKCVKHIQETDADNVGGIVRTQPVSGSILGRTIAAVLASRFGVGGSKFRTGVTSPEEVDTVPFGFYKRAVFDRIGLFNENLVRNQDIEFNLRLKRKGGKIILFPDIDLIYFSRSSLRSFLKNNYENGFWVIFASRYSKQPFSLRHIIPLMFVLYLGLVILLLLLPITLALVWVIPLLFYTILDVLFSVEIVRKTACCKAFFVSAMIFPLLHISYGTGSLIASVKLLWAKG
ncbi:MAG: Glycosyl transferase [Thermotogales bacterium 46_20]|nr:MAG: Glycosyl transferase [Thermotogales bacterium 46_20]